MTDLTQRARDAAGRLKARAEKVQEWSTSSQRVVDLLKPEMDKFDAKEAPWDIYTVRMSVDHVSSIRTQAKEIADLAEAAAIIAELIERVEGVEGRDNTQAFMADLLAHGTAMRDSTGRHIPIHDWRLTDAEIEAKRVLGKQEGEG